MRSRREFLQHGALAGLAGLALPAAPALDQSPSRPAAAGSTFLDLTRPPDVVAAQVSAASERLLYPAGSSSSRWEDAGIVVTLAAGEGTRILKLEAPATGVRRLRLRWRGRLGGVRLVMGDAWERGYGDFEWRGFVPDRVLPWYFATFDGRLTHAYGVRTGANAFCFWQADPDGLTLYADVRSGGANIQLGPRVLDACEIVSRPGTPGESSFTALHAFCRDLCAAPRLPPHPVYGSNDWYWAYGRNSAETALADAARVVELSPPDANRPFAVIDDGWQPERGRARTGVGTWDRGNEKFPDMPDLAAGIRRAGARPGLWIRPLLAASDTPDGWRLPRDHTILDPSVPEVLQKVADDVRRVRGWGFDLVKHDYSTFDIFGRWGSTMADVLTRDGWGFAMGSTRTTAEIVAGLYRTIREAAGDALVIGCNTVSHLSAGVFDICRIGDDTSGRDWTRTRKMGVNSLAFRGVQHGAFYVADADCVGVTTAIPWTLNRRWLDLLARSGTMLFVSLAPDAIGDDERRDLRAALALAAGARPLAQPLDWQQMAWPSRWHAMDRDVTYDWIDG